MAWSIYPDGCYINLPHNMYWKAREKDYPHPYNYKITQTYISQNTQGSISFLSSHQAA